LARIRDNLGPNNGYRRSIIGDFSEYNDLRDCGRRVTATNTISAEKPISIPAKHVQPTKRADRVCVMQCAIEREKDLKQPGGRYRTFSWARQQRFITRIVGAPSDLMSSIKSAQSGFLNFEDKFSADSGKEYLELTYFAIMKVQFTREKAPDSPATATTNIARNTTPLPPPPPATVVARCDSVVVAS
nr:catalase [Tanacetum cinerariifolium]